MTFAEFMRNPDPPPMSHSIAGQYFKWMQAYQGLGPVVYPTPHVLKVLAVEPPMIQYQAYSQSGEPMGQIFWLDSGALLLIEPTEDERRDWMMETVLP